MPAATVRRFASGPPGVVWWGETNRSGRQTLTKAKIQAGVCGFETTVEACLGDDGRTCEIRLASPCGAVAELGDRLGALDAFQEISHAGAGSTVLRLARELCHHTACPVPVGIIKALEVEAGLALPAEARISIEQG
jgi:hypothetical protein